MTSQKSLTVSQLRFNNNLIKLSKQTNYEESIDEWIFIENIHSQQYDNNCLCGKPLKHQYYYINKTTYKIICAGKSCRQRLKRIEKEIKSQQKKDLLEIVKFFKTNGIKNIGEFDLIVYCENNIQIIIKFAIIWHKT